MTRTSVLRIAQWLVLGGWLGALGLFAFAVAPTTFKTAPSVEVAGQIVGPVLRGLNLYGLASGIALALLAWRLDRGTLLVGVPLLLAVVCGISEFAVTAAISEVLPHDLGPDTPSASAGRFASLHQLSRVLYAIVMTGVVFLVAAHARADDPGQST